MQPSHLSFLFLNPAEWSISGLKQLVFWNANLIYSVAVADVRWKNRELSGVNQIFAMFSFYACC